MSRCFGYLSRLTLYPSHFFYSLHQFPHYSSSLPHHFLLSPNIISSCCIPSAAVSPWFFLGHPTIHLLKVASLSLFLSFLCSTISRCPQSFYQSFSQSFFSVIFFSRFAYCSLMARELSARFLLSLSPSSSISSQTIQKTHHHHDKK